MILTLYYLKIKQYIVIIDTFYNYNILLRIYFLNSSQSKINFVKCLLQILLTKRNQKLFIQILLYSIISANW